MAKLVTMPVVELQKRDTDLELTPQQMLELSLFKQLKTKPSVDRFPGAIVLRRYRKGEVVFRQGEAGWTAFYPLTTEDVVTILGNQVSGVWNINDQFGKPDAATLKAWQSWSGVVQKSGDLRRIGTVHLAVGRPSGPAGRGVLSRLSRRLFGGLARGDSRPKFIPIDGPRDIDYETLEAPVIEGEMFGEMSCLNLTPRSGTVVVSRDCYMLEMLRNILESLQRDKDYKKKTDDLYIERVLQMHLRRLSIFSELTDEQFNQVKKDLELVTFERGDLICDEYERSDCMYIIRSGMVKVLKKASALLSADNIRSWVSLLAALKEGAEDATKARGKVWSLLPEALRTRLLAVPGADQLTPADKTEVLVSLNEVIKDATLPNQKELKPALEHANVKDWSAYLPTDRKKFGDVEVRAFNRFLLQQVYVGIIRPYTPRVGPECILAYCAKGDNLGEMGLLTGQPRSATCVAYSHTDAGNLGRTEVVKVPRSTFDRILKASPVVRGNLEAAAAGRRAQADELANRPIFDEADKVQHGENFEKLGLIQGQRLMLIDLDRCTRCDECVRACVNTHDDHRSRLFLDGPRFGRYLIPLTCRSCLDPVCMVGCPVGSIHRGDNLQIVIENWCIGCGLCAKNCPYGSIQMYDIGVVPNGARGWRFQPADALGDARWYEPRFRDSDWPTDTAPFRRSKDFDDKLAARLKGEVQPAILRSMPLCFRFEFNLASYLAHPGSEYRLEVESQDPQVTLWVNGEEVQSDSDKPKRNKREYTLPQKPESAATAPASAAPASDAPMLRSMVGQVPPLSELKAAAVGAKRAKSTAPRGVLRAGRNVLAVLVRPNPSAGEVLLDARLDYIHKPEGAKPGDEVSEKMVMERAVVCDLCSTLPSQIPSCVNACPHDAAFRVDALYDFPTS